MTYLVTTSCIAQCDTDIILGISDSKMGIFEILWNYTRLNIECYKQTFEDDASYNDICIYKISQKDYEYLDTLYKKYNEELDDKQAKLNFDNTAVMAYFWYGTYLADSDGCDFTKKECAKIMRIIERSESVFDE